MWWRHLDRCIGGLQTHAVDTVDVSELDEARFFSEFVHQGKPCLIKGAAKHWPAMDRWKDPTLLSGRLDNKNIWVERELDWTYGRRKHHEISSAVFFSEKLSADDDKYWYFLNQNFKPFECDLGRFSFLSYPLPKPRRYRPHRIFFYRKSYTDWHNHPTDEGLMTQIVGNKRTALMPPTRKTWDLMNGVLGHGSHLIHDNPKTFFERADVHVVEVCAGDSLYIPPHWWHAVQACGEAYGATVATTFRTPLSLLGSWQTPRARQMLFDLSPYRNASIHLASQLVVASLLSLSTLSRWVRGQAPPRYWTE
jgi:hypothetical protein